MRAWCTHCWRMQDCAHCRMPRRWRHSCPCRSSVGSSVRRGVVSRQNCPRPLMRHRRSTHRLDFRLRPARWKPRRITAPGNNRGDMENNRPVVVKRIPERLNSKQAKAFMREMDKVVNSDRPQLVFDCSHVKQIDAAGIEMLLHCLARAIKHDGDLKLASVSPQM